MRQVIQRVKSSDRMSVEGVLRLAAELGWQPGAINASGVAMGTRGL